MQLLGHRARAHEGFEDLLHRAEPVAQFFFRLCANALLGRRIVQQAGGRFEMLTSADNREAADGCFTATLTELLRSGEASRGESLRCVDAKELVQQACSKQVATWLAFDGRRFTRQGDAGLWLGRNPARRAGLAPLAGTPTWGQVEQLTAWFERPPQLDQLYDTVRIERALGDGPFVAALSAIMSCHRTRRAMESAS